MPFDELGFFSLSFRGPKIVSLKFDAIVMWRFFRTFVSSSTCGTGRSKSSNFVEGDFFYRISDCWGIVIFLGRGNEERQIIITIVRQNFPSPSRIARMTFFPVDFSRKSMQQCNGGPKGKKRAGEKYELTISFSLKFEIVEMSLVEVFGTR